MAPPHHDDVTGLVVVRSMPAIAFAGRLSCCAAASAGHRHGRRRLPPPRQVGQGAASAAFAALHSARLVELVDTRDLKSLGSKELCRFESGSGHQQDPSTRAADRITGFPAPQLYFPNYDLKIIGLRAILVVEHSGRAQWARLGITRRQRRGEGNGAEIGEACRVRVDSDRVSWLGRARRRARGEPDRNRSSAQCDFAADSLDARRNPRSDAGGFPAAGDGRSAAAPARLPAGEIQPLRRAHRDALGLEAAIPQYANRLQRLSLWNDNAPVNSVTISLLLYHQSTGRIYWQAEARCEGLTTDAIPAAMIVPMMNEFGRSSSGELACTRSS